MYKEETRKMLLSLIVAEGYHEGGVLGCWAPLGPSIEGMGLRRAFAIGIRGTPWMTRGSFIKEGSSLAGTACVISKS